MWYLIGAILILALLVSLLSRRGLGAFILGFLIGQS